MGGSCATSNHFNTKQHLPELHSTGTGSSRISLASRRSTTTHLSPAQEKFAIAKAFTVLSEAYRGDLDSIKSFIQEGFPPDFPLNTQGWTLSHVAAQTGNVDLLKFLVSINSDLDCQEVAEGWTPLMIAAINDLLDVAEFLVKQQSDIYLTDLSGNTAEDLAVKYRSSKVSAYLNAY